MQENNIRIYLKVFWPAILYTAIFICYCSLVRDFYSTEAVFNSELFLVILIACYYIFPGLSILQLIYGIINIVRKQGRKAWLHVYAAGATFFVFGIFLLSLAIGNYPSA